MSLVLEELKGKIVDEIHDNGSSFIVAFTDGSTLSIYPVDDEALTYFVTPKEV